MASPTPGPRSYDVDRFTVHTYVLADGTVRKRTEHLVGHTDVTFQDTPPVDPPPANRPPDVTATYQVKDLTVTFDGTTSDPDGDVITHRWEFGDGSTADTVDAVHTYPSSGTYTVKLTATDAKGASAFVSFDVKVTAPAPPPPPAGTAIQVQGNRLVRPDGHVYQPYWQIEEYNPKGGTPFDGGWPNFAHVVDGVATMSSGLRYLPFILLDSTNVFTGKFLNLSPNGAGYMPPPETRGNNDMNLWQGVGLDQILAVIDRNKALGRVTELALAGGVVEDLYMRPDVRDALQDPKRVGWVMIHAVGEDYHDNGPVYDAGPPRAWRDHCITVLQKFRNFGYTVPLIFMSNNGGRNARTILDYAAQVLAADPLKNSVFGWQVYWNGTLDSAPADGFLYQQISNRTMRQAITESAQRTDICIIMGACGNPGALGSQYPPVNEIVDLVGKVKGNLAYWDWCAASGAMVLSGDSLPAPGSPAWNRADVGADPTDGERIANYFRSYADKG